jgi:hypothetical protein
VPGSQACAGAGRPPGGQWVSGKNRRWIRSRRSELLEAACTLRRPALRGEWVRGGGLECNRGVLRDLEYKRLEGSDSTWIESGSVWARPGWGVGAGGVCVGGGGRGTGAGNGVL